MSAVLMCDSCGNLFSVNDENWSEFNERIPAEKSNAHNNGVRSMHIGPCCKPSSDKVTPKVRIAIAPPDKSE